MLKKQLPLTPFDNLKLLIADELEGVDKLIISAAQSYVELIPMITHYLTSAGGKRLRPMLTLLCSKMFDIKSDAHIKLATAVEYIHTATLLHDDVIDESQLRRGKKVANLVWGNKTSILVGDYLLSQAFRLMVSAENINALDLLARTACSITESEIWQTEIMKKIDLPIEDYLKLITGKTALLFAAACSVGAILNDRPHSERDALYNFGLNLGICFQITDDTLDYMSSNEELGKTVGNDLREGKVTLPLILAYKFCLPDEQKFLVTLFDGQPYDQERLQKILHTTNALEKSKEVAYQYMEKSLQDLKAFKTSDYIQALVEISKFIPTRLS